MYQLKLDIDFWVTKIERLNHIIKIGVIGKRADFSGTHIGTNKKANTEKFSVNAFFY